MRLGEHTHESVPGNQHRRDSNHAGNEGAADGWPREAQNPVSHALTRAGSKLFDCLVSYGSGGGSAPGAMAHVA